MARAAREDGLCPRVVLGACPAGTQVARAAREDGLCPPTAPELARGLRPPCRPAPAGAPRSTASGATQSVHCTHARGAGIRAPGPGSCCGGALSAAASAAEHVRTSGGQRKALRGTAAAGVLPFVETAKIFLDSAAVRTAFNGFRIVMHFLNAAHLDSKAAARPYLASNKAEEWAVQAPHYRTVAAGAPRPFALYRIGAAAAPLPPRRVTGIPGPNPAARDAHAARAAPLQAPGVARNASRLPARTARRRPPAPPPRGRRPRRVARADRRRATWNPARRRAARILHLPGICQASSRRGRLPGSGRPGRPSGGELQTVNGRPRVCQAAPAGAAPGKGRHHVDAVSGDVLQARRKVRGGTGHASRKVLPAGPGVLHSRLFDASPLLEAALFGRASPLYACTSRSVEPDALRQPDAKLREKAPRGLGQAATKRGGARGRRGAQ